MPDFGPDTDPTGGTRFSAGKPPMWWAIPMRGLRLVARVTAYGAEKYAPLDWAEGQSFGTLFDCLCRHVESMATFGIWSKDEESGLYHASHAAWNLLTLLHFMALERHDLDDVTKWRGVTAKTKDLTPIEPVPHDGEPTQCEPPSGGPPPPPSLCSEPGAQHIPTPDERLEDLRKVDPGFAALVEESPAWKDLKGYREVSNPYTPPYRTDRDEEQELPRRPRRPRPRYDR